MKLLHTSDLHIGKSLSDYSLLEDQAHILKQIAAYAKEEAVDAVLIAGDLYDRSIPPSEAVVLLDRFLSQLTLTEGIPVIAISGNHDGGKRLSFARGLYESCGLYLRSIPDAVLSPITLSDQMGPVHIWCLPYADLPTLRSLLAGAGVAPEHLPTTLSGAYAALLAQNRDAFDFSARNVLIAHSFFGWFAGAGERNPQELIFSEGEVSVGGTDIVDASLFADFDYAAMGHLHAPQRIGCDTVRYSGSPLKYSVSEAGREKSVTLITLAEKGDVTQRQLPLFPLRDVRVLRGFLHEFTDRALLPKQNFQDYVFFELLDEAFLLDAMQKLRVNYPNVLGIRMVRHEEDVLLAPVSSGQLAKKTMEELFSQFFEAVRGSSLTEEEAQVMEDVFSHVRHREGGDDA